MYKQVRTHVIAATRQNSVLSLILLLYNRCPYHHAFKSCATSYKQYVETKLKEVLLEQSSIHWGNRRRLRCTNRSKLKGLFHGCCWQNNLSLFSKLRHITTLVITHCLKMCCKLREKEKNTTKNIKLKPALLRINTFNLLFLYWSVFRKNDI